MSCHPKMRNRLSVLFTIYQDRPSSPKISHLTASYLLRKEVIHPHVPVRIPCYDLTPIIPPTLGLDKLARQVLVTFMVWRAVCTRPGNVFTVVCWPTITSDSGFMQASFSLQSELRPALMGFAPSRDLAALCTGHCSVFVAPGVREIRTWHHPPLPPCYQGSLARKIQLTIRVALVDGLNQTSHDTSWRRPCITCHRIPFGTLSFRRNSRDVKPG
jgi:hypothetical protein